MPTSLCAVPNPNDKSNQHQPLTPREARVLVASLSRKAEETIAADMVADYLELHPTTPVSNTTQPTDTITACPSPDKKGGNLTTDNHPYHYDRSNLTSHPTRRSGYHFDTDPPRSLPFTNSTYYHHTNN